MQRKVLFVSTNYTWGGSEILWSNTAVQLAQEGHKIRYGIKYDPMKVKKLSESGAGFINLNPTYIYPSIKVRLLRKLKLWQEPMEPFLHAILVERPDLVVISQGNNADGKYYMTVCREQNIPYITIIQLVTEIIWPFISDETINELRLGYRHAQKNYFVSEANLRLHTIMMGEAPIDAAVVLNPFTVPYNIEFRYPNSQAGYKIALVGRLEALHKGHDLLLNVLQQDKWKSRPVTFSFYGEGPHKMLLERLVKQYSVTNVEFKGHVQDIADIWNTHHLLILPSRMEGQALALIEAMWCYRAAIVTDVGGARELIEDGIHGYLASYPTLQHLDETLERAWQNRDQWENMGKEAGEKIRSIYHSHPINLFAGEIKEQIQMSIKK